MSSSTYANHAKIGLVLVLGIAAIFSTLVYLGGAENKENLIAETYCESAVSGLSIGSEVTFRGVKVGEVKDISFVWREYADANDADAKRVLIKLALDSAKLIPNRELSPGDAMRKYIEKGLRATIVSSGITGMSHVELNYPKNPAPVEKISWRPNEVCIPPAPSILESFSDSATRLVNELNTMDFSLAWSNTVMLVETATKLCDSMNMLIETQSAAISGVLGEAEETGARMRELADELQENPSLLLRARDVQPLPETER